MVEKDEAASFAEKNAASEESILRTYWFPDQEELRLVHVDPTTLPSEGHLRPFHFGPDPSDGILHPVKIAFILPEEENRLELPAGWGEWNQAVRVYESPKAA